MKRTAPHLTDEHMNLYEWCGGVATGRSPAEAPRLTAATSALLALAALLLFTGCTSQGAAERAAPSGDTGHEAAPGRPAAGEMRL